MKNFNTLLFLMMMPASSFASTCDGNYTIVANGQTGTINIQAGADSEAIVGTLTFDQIGKSEKIVGTCKDSDPMFHNAAVLQFVRHLDQSGNKQVFTGRLVYSPHPFYSKPDKINYIDDGTFSDSRTGKTDNPFSAWLSSLSFNNQSMCYGSYHLTKQNELDLYVKMGALNLFPDYTTQKTMGILYLKETNQNYMLSNVMCTAISFTDAYVTFQVTHGSETEFFGLHLDREGTSEYVDIFGYYVNSTGRHGVWGGR